MYCKKCGTQNEDDAKFCGKCGTKIAEDEKFVFCENCGAKMKNSAMFCKSCGTKITQNEEVKEPVKTAEPVKSSVNTSDSMTHEPSKADLIKQIFGSIINGNIAEAQAGIQGYLASNEMSSEICLAKLFIEMRVRNISELKNINKPISGSANYTELLRLSDDKSRETLIGISNYINQSIDHIGTSGSTYTAPEPVEPMTQAKPRKLKICRFCETEAIPNRETCYKCGASLYIENEPTNNFQTTNSADIDKSNATIPEMDINVRRSLVRYGRTVSIFRFLDAIAWIVVIIYQLSQGVFSEDPFTIIWNIVATVITIGLAIRLLTYSNADYFHEKEFEQAMSVNVGYAGIGIIWYIIQAVASEIYILIPLILLEIVILVIGIMASVLMSRKSNHPEIKVSARMANMSNGELKKNYKVLLILGIIFIVFEPVFIFMAVTAGDIYSDSYAQTFMVVMAILTPITGIALIFFASIYKKYIQLREKDGVSKNVL